MSYPGFLSPSTNLSADVSTQRGVNDFSYVLNDGSVAPSGSSLQSPASITPDSAGNTSLAFNATGTGSSLISLNAAGGLPTQNAIHFGNPSGVGVALYQNASLGGGLQIGNDSVLSNIASFNNATNNVTLGKVGVVGTINLNAATVIKDFAGGANGLGLSPTSVTQSIIGQTCATDGILALASSVSNQQVLEVADITGVGGVYIRSVDGQAPLVFSSDNTESVIAVGLPNSGTLKLASSAANIDAITITDTATAINKLGGAPQNLAITGLSSGNLAPGTIGSPTLFSFPAPTGEGLYAITGASSGVSTANSRQAQCSSICYVGPTGVVAIGGSAFADVGSIGSDDNIQWSAANNTVFNGSYVGSQQVNNFVVLAFKISGPIPGTF